jgi:hypothetical protein
VSYLIPWDSSTSLFVFSWFRSLPVYWSTSFIESDILFPFISIILTQTQSPSCKMSPASLTLPSSLISLTWQRPSSLRPNWTKAPKSFTFLTVPLNHSPILISCLSHPFDSQSYDLHLLQCRLLESESLECRLLQCFHHESDLDDECLRLLFFLSLFGDSLFGGDDFFDSSSKLRSRSISSLLSEIARPGNFLAMKVFSIWEPSSNLSSSVGFFFSSGCSSIPCASASFSG